MANLEIQGKKVELTTNDPYKSDFVCEISFNTPETENTEMCKSANIPLGRGSRSNFTFDRVESEINDYFNKYHEDLEIVNFKSIKIYEKQRFKQRPFDNYEY